MSKFFDGLNSPGGRSFLLASLWVFMFVLLFILKMMGVTLEAEGRALIADASKMLLGGLLLSLGVSATKPSA